MQVLLESTSPGTRKLPCCRQLLCQERANFGCSWHHYIRISPSGSKAHYKGNARSHGLQDPCVCGHLGGANHSCPQQQPEGWDMTSLHP